MDDILAAREKYVSLSARYKVAVHELDFMENLKPSAILQYFQDIATQHANELGVGHSDMSKKGLFWILSRVSYRYFKPLSYGSGIEIITFPQKPRRVDVNRIYYIIDDNKQLVASGDSKWCVLSSDTHSIARMEGVFEVPEDKFFNQLPFENANPAIPPIDSLNLSRLSRFENCVKVTDLDKNRHMNNARYGDAVLNCMTLDELSDRSIKSLDINYLSELCYGDKFTVTRGDGDGASYFEAGRSDKKAAAFRAKITW